MHQNEQAKNELEQLIIGLRESMEIADAHSRIELDYGVRDCFWHDEYFRRKADYERALRLAQLLNRSCCDVTTVNG